MRQPWERRDKESLQAFEAFMTYLTQPLPRSSRVVAETLGKSVGLMERWCARHEWKLRAAAWEEHFAIRVVDSMADQREQIMREHADFAAVLLRKSRVGLSALADEIAADPVEQEGLVATIDQYLRAGDLAVKVGRLATGLDGKFVPSTGGGTDLSGLDPEELDLLESLLEKAKR